MLETVLDTLRAGFAGFPDVRQSTGTLARLLLAAPHGDAGSPAPTPQ